MCIINPNDFYIRLLLFTCHGNEERQCLACVLADNLLIHGALDVITPVLNKIHVSYITYPECIADGLHDFQVHDAYIRDEAVQFDLPERPTYLPGHDDLLLAPHVLHEIFIPFYPVDDFLRMTVFRL